MRWLWFTLFLLINISSEAQNYCSQKIENHEQFQRMEGLPLVQKYGGVTTVKVLWDIRNSKLYFIDGTHYVYHYEFSTYELGNQSDVYDFNQINYKSNPFRKYVLGNINYYPLKKYYTLEFAEAEELSQANAMLYSLVAEQVFFKDKFYLYLSTQKHIDQWEKLDKNIPILTVDEIYNDIVYQPLVKKTATGILRKVSLDSLKNTNLLSTDILLINGSPLEVSAVAGIITTQFQTPLSHLCLLSQNRKTPLLAYKNAWSNEYILSLINKPIKIDVQNDTFYISEIKLEEIIPPNENKKTIQASLNLNKKGIISVENIRANDVAFAGGKAANLGELYHIKFSKNIPVLLPEKALVVPMTYYWQHVQKANIQSELNALNQANNTTQTASFDTLLKAIRKKITKQPLDSVFRQLLVQALKQNYTDTTVLRFRSSTNAEDIEGFNGAGLYNSKSGKISDSISIDKAIKNVWASLWNKKAYLERLYFGIDQEQVAMAVLIHPAFGTELINGVALTKNLYRPEHEGYIINMQQGEMPVVFSSNDITAELSILYQPDYYANEKLNVEYLSFSNFSKDKSLLNKQETQDLYDVLHKIKSHYFYEVKHKNCEYGDFAVDVEFKWIMVNNQKKLVIKQARLFNN